MNKKLFLALFAIIGLLFATSCTHEELDAVQDSEFAEVSLSIGLEGGLGTKAISDGSGANKLVYAVYNSQNQLITTIEGSTNGEFVKDPAFNALKETVSFTLAKGQTYTAVFWAQNKACNAYTVTTETDGIKVAVDYSGFNNDETRDAFFAYKTFTVTGREEIDVTLRRPFAQINVGVTQDDWNSAVNSGITVSESKVVIKNAATSINLLDGSVSDETAVEYDFAAIPANSNEILKVDLDKDGNFADHEKFVYLSMSYILTGEQKSTLLADGLNFTFHPVSGEDITFNEGLHNVPVQRNWRTNIIGQILTGDITFNITIDPIPFDNNNIIHPDGYKIEGTTAFVSTPQGLAAVAEGIANGEIPANTDVTLTGDLDLSTLSPSVKSEVKSNWTPIGTSAKPFTGTFDGNGYTIKNLTIVEKEAKEGKAYIGFFGYAKDATIKNVTFENVYINIPCLDIDHSQGHIGAVAGSLEGTSTIENVTVKGDITVYATQTANGASRVAVVAGGNSYGNVTMKNVHVIANEGSSLIANNNTGALAGQLQGKMYFENCSSNIDVTVNKFFAGGLIGIAAGDSQFINCHTTGDVAVVAGRAGRANDHYRVGGIAGGWADGKDKVCTLENCSYTGNVSGKNADGSVAETLDYWGYVGRGYALTNCAGSKVVIDGTEFVQKFDNVYGVYTINGLTPVSTADELVAALEANEGVLFMNDIKIEPAKMSNAYGKTGINVRNGQTIDGNGYTLNIKGAGDTWDSGINTTGGLIKNLTVTGSFRGIFINHTSTHSEKVVLQNVTIGGNGTVYTISCDKGLYQGIEATNCTFNGWTSFAKTAGEAKFINCSFGEGSNYKYCRPYSNTEFVGCTFCSGFNVDETHATVTFTNCTWED